MPTTACPRDQVVGCSLAIRRVALSDSSRLIAKLRNALSDDLRRPPWRGSPNPIAGHCYVASEALFHLLGGREAGITIYRIRHENQPHWFLRDGTGVVLDPTADQFATPVPYELGRRTGFLTREPSRRARVLMSRLS